MVRLSIDGHFDACDIADAGCCRRRLMVRLSIDRSFGDCDFDVGFGGSGGGPLKAKKRHSEYYIAASVI